MNDIEITHHVAATMRDGTILRADVYSPKGEGPFPVLVFRTPYDKTVPMTYFDYPSGARKGYIIVVQDVRGSFASDGEWIPWKHEREDGYDTVEWAAGLPRSNGRVGVVGPSYLGNTTWGAAIANPPHLAAIAPSVTFADPDDGLMFRGGAIELGLNGGWSAGTGLARLFRAGADPQAASLKQARALEDLNTIATKGYWDLPSGALPMLRRLGMPDIGVARALADRSTMEESRVSSRLKDVTAPSLNIGGWYDVFLQGTLDNYTGMRSHGRVARLVVGPWDHYSLSTGHFARPIVGEVPFGRAAGLANGKNHVDLHTEWFDHWLKGEPATAAHESGALIFIMGANEWRAEADWPLAREVLTPFYLHSDGGLGVTPSREENAETRYTYDPADPVMTRGGNLASMWTDFVSGPVDQREAERRDDVLVFTTDPLTADAEITGRVRAILHVATDGPSTDWVARLCEVDTAGVSRNIVDGVTRVHAEPGRDEEVHIDLWSTSIRIRAGHRLRVHITSSNFPRWDRNLNTGEPESEGTTIRVAEQRILHDRAHPSRIILPIIPG